jgi:hypothetical protein
VVILYIGALCVKTRDGAAANRPIRPSVGMDGGGRALELL